MATSEPSSATSIETSTLDRGAMLGMAMLMPEGNDRPATVVATLTVVAFITTGPPLATLRVSLPCSPASSFPSALHDSTLSSRVSSPMSTRGLTSKDSMMPLKSSESRAGPTAQVPAPRRAKASAKVAASSGLRAAAAARIASRASV